jgi:hypothetical protein
MTECQRCGGRATLFLCPRCESHLDKLLRELPWWLERLTETAVGATRLRVYADEARDLAAALMAAADYAERDQ